MTPISRFQTPFFPPLPLCPEQFVPEPWKGTLKTGHNALNPKRLVATFKSRSKAHEPRVFKFGLVFVFPPNGQESNRPWLARSLSLPCHDPVQRRITHIHPIHPLTHSSFYTTSHPVFASPSSLLPRNQRTT